MNIRKSIALALAAMAIALSAFASSASAATDGVLRDTGAGTPLIANGATLHFVGWMKFGSELGGIQCHVTLTAEATGAAGTTLSVKQIVITDTIGCAPSITFSGCKVTSDEVRNLPYAGTVTPTDFDVTGSILIKLGLSNCTFGFTKANLSFSSITLKPLTTGTRTVTNTSNLLGTTAAVGDPIAGVEISGSGTAEIDTGSVAIEASGELELTSPGRCTYKLAAS